MNQEDRILLADLMEVEVEDHADQIDEMLHIASLYQKNKIDAERLPKRADRKKELEVFAKALEVVINPGDTTKHVFNGIVEYDHLLRNAATVNSILRTIIAEKSAYGPEPDDRKWAIRRLSSVYGEITGLSPKTSWNSHTEMYCGRFYDVCKVLLPHIPWDSLGRVIVDVLKEHKE